MVAKHRFRFQFVYGDADGNTDVKQVRRDALRRVNKAKQRQDTRFIKSRKLAPQFAFPSVSLFYDDMAVKREKHKLAVNGRQIGIQLRRRKQDNQSKKPIVKGDGLQVHHYARLGLLSSRYLENTGPEVTARG